MDASKPTIPESKQSWLPLTSQVTNPTLIPATRPALAPLAALPMDQKPKLATTKTSPATLPQLGENGALTPPATPQRPCNKRASISADGIESLSSIGVNLGAKPADILNSMAEQAKEDIPAPDLPPKLYTKRYTLHEELGYGVWSTVYRASEIPEPSTLPPSPPTSPLNGAKQDPKTNQKVLAIKKPSRRDAYPILETEARILTYLHSHPPGSTQHIVPFHGWDPSTHSIILTALPLSLETHAQTLKKTTPLTTKNIFDPILGFPTWTHLTTSLVAGLSFLHSHHCIHGDIKPANILLRPSTSSTHSETETETLTPLFCDFSSSHLLPPQETNPSSPSPSPPLISAVSPEYTAPELLSSLAHPTPTHSPIATYSSDIFSLAVTLLFAALGESPYACCKMEMQRLGAAREGRPLEFARRGEGAGRVRGVEGTLGGALERVGDRWGVVEWEEVVLRRGGES
ncbi:hypothetical protein JMJ35_000377 [Cladonia borealis]|uniref:Protein kinase domain-containing protein n=1 Tax=Cladonia borealis TaxID=184061 RepID=A0AA39R943_9LECA|nr:hypothetical protein JMJ35_000377 [Cladonia borealis]